jgi:hypothetical protein
MTALTEQQRDMLRLYALGDRPVDIARDLGLARTAVVDELTQLCELNRDTAAAMLAERRDLATLPDCSCDSDIVLPHAPHLPEHVAAIAATPQLEETPLPTPKRRGRPPKLAAGGIIHQPRTEPTYVDYRAYRCTDCGRIGPDPCQPGHAGVSVTVRIFDAVVA